MQTVTLDSEDFRVIHNTLCDLRSLARGMERRMIKIEEVEGIIQQFEQGLANAYAQDDDIFDRKCNYYRQFACDNQLDSVWSLFELPMHGFLNTHPYPSDSFVVYCGRHYPVQGPLWGDVYRAADLAIQQSGDQHHVFIEGFDAKGNELHMYTGS